MKKRILSLLLTISCIFSAFPVMAAGTGHMTSGSIFNPDDWEYEIRKGDIVLSKYTGTGTELVIEPSAVIDGQDYRVVLQGASGGYGTFPSDVTEITIREGVRAADDISGLFSNLGKLTMIDLSGFDTSNTANMQNLFSGCSSLAEIDLSGLDTSKVKSMNHMFSSCSSLKEVDLSVIDTANVRDFGGLFADCKALEELDLSSVNTARAENFSDMFRSCTSLTEIGFGAPDTSRVENMQGMFYNCSALEDLDLSGFDTGKVRTMRSMFSYCSNLEDIDLTSFDTGKVEDMCDMFSHCSKLEEIDISGFNTKKLKDAGYLFYDCDALETINVSSLNGDKITSIYQMFGDCASLEEIVLDGLNTSSVSDFGRLFANCKSLEYLDLSVLDTRSASSMDSMFSGCARLEEVVLDGLDTSGVENMSSMFSGCTALTGLDLSGLSANSLVYLPNMFSGCENLEYINLKGFKTHKAVNMSGMFKGCSSLTALDLSDLDTWQVTSMDSMFAGCRSLTALDLSGFDLSNCTNVSYMFDSADSLQEIAVPVHLKNGVTASLPGTFKDPSGAEFTELPQGIGESFIISHGLPSGTSGSSGISGVDKTDVSGSSENKTESSSTGKNEGTGSDADKDDGTDSDTDTNENAKTARSDGKTSGGSSGNSGNKTEGTSTGGKTETTGGKDKTTEEKDTTSGKKTETVSGQDEAAETAIVTDEAPEATLCGITLDLSNFDLRNQSVEVAVTNLGTGTTEDGEVCHEYEISVGSRHEYDDPVMLVFRSDDPQNHVIEHFDEQLQEWVPLLTFEGPEDGTVCCLTRSFSNFREVTAKYGPLFTIGGQGTPQAGIGINKNYSKILREGGEPLYAETMEKFGKNPGEYRLELPAIEAESTPEQIISSFETANGWWSLVAPLVDVSVGLVPMEKPPMAIALVDGRFAPYTADFKTHLSNAMTDISLLTMGIQVCTDVYKYGFDSKTTAINAYKNMLTNAGTIYSLHTGYSSAALSLYFIGVTIFSMELDYVIDYAKQTQEEISTDIFNTYYENIHPFDWQYWYKLYTESYWKNGMNASKASDEINRALDRYAEEFWSLAGDTSNEDFIFAVAESNYKNFFDLSQDQKDQLTAEFKLDLRRRFLHEVMPKIERFLIERMDEQLRKSLYSIVEPFNRDLHFTIKEHADLATSPTSSAAQYTGCTLAFGKGDTVIKNEGWYLTAPDDEIAQDGWSLDFTATDYAWMCANLPDTLFVYASYDDMAKGKEPLKKVAFTLNTTENNNRTTYIDLSEDYTYAWSLSKIVISNNPAREDTSFSALTDAWADAEQTSVEFQMKDSDGNLTTYTDTIYTPGQCLAFPEHFSFTGYYDTECPEQDSSMSADGKAFAKESVTSNGYYGHEFDGRKVIAEPKEGMSVTVKYTHSEYLVSYVYDAFPYDEAGARSPEVIVRKDDNKVSVKLSGAYNIDEKDLTDRNGRPYKRIDAEWSGRNSVSITITGSESLDGISYKLYYNTVLQEYIDSKTLDYAENLRHDARSMTKTLPPLDEVTEGTYEIVVYAGESSTSQKAQYVIVLNVVEEKESDSMNPFAEGVVVDVTEEVSDEVLSVVEISTPIVGD